MNTVECPVIGGQINGDDCYLICEVADNMIKPSVLYNQPSVLPEGVIWNDALKAKCLNCQYHSD
ncbi:MAG: hypothetical protein IJQ81_08120 [Oscillibacter sp.]|nr:hypothetical protein [Oscillibacter sp.]